MMLDGIEISRRRGTKSKGFSIFALTTTAILRVCGAFSMALLSPTAYISCVRRHRSATVARGYRLPFALMMSESDDQSQSPSISIVAATPSERSQRKAAQRARKQSRQGQANMNKETSQHPDAILKRKLQKDQSQSPGTGTRRKHNFAQRANYLQEKEKLNDDFDVDLNGLRCNQLTNTNMHPVENPYDHTNHDPVVHPLHSTRVEKLDTLSTSADDVVKAIKRAQNYHDMHDIREIAHFLLEEVGELLNAI